MLYRINYNRTTNVVRLESGVTAPAAIGGPYQNLGTFDHDTSDEDDDDTLPGQKVSESHAIYHHVRDALYRQESEQNMQVQLIYRDRVRTLGGTATLSLEEEATASIPTTTFVPANTQEKGLTYESDDTDTATVDADGLVTGVAAGTANVIVSSIDDPSVTRTVVVTVTTP